MSKTSAKPVQTTRFDPVYNLTSIFTAHRDLRRPAKLTLGDSGLSTEEADILVFLLGAAQLGWDDLPLNAEGLVALKDLRMALVYDPSLFGRRIRKLATQKEPLVEVRRMKTPAKLKLHGNSQGARITKAGIATATRIWESFRRLSTKLLNGLPQADLEVHVQVNETISKRLRDLADPAKQLLAD